MVVSDQKKLLLRAFIINKVSYPLIVIGLIFVVATAVFWPKQYDCDAQYKILNCTCFYNNYNLETSDCYKLGILSTFSSCNLFYEQSYFSEDELNQKIEEITSPDFKCDKYGHVCVGEIGSKTGLYIYFSVGITLIISWLIFSTVKFVKMKRQLEENTSLP